MRRKRITSFLLGLSVCLLLLTACQVSPVQPVAAVDASTAATDGELYLPRFVRPAYATGTRSLDGNPGPNYWQNYAAHNMVITVSPPDNIIHATQTITYTNNSPYGLPYIVFRLYQNVHQPEAMREKQFPPEFLTPGFEIDSFTVNGEAVPWSDVSVLGTIGVLNLTELFMPNTSMVFTFDWHFELSPFPVKSGVVDETTFFLAYFFPRVVVYNDTDAGLIDQEQFTYGREFYNEFTDFTFAVDVPKNFIVWATGELLNSDEVLQPQYDQRLQESYSSDEILNIAQPDEIQMGVVTTQTDRVIWKWKADNVLDVAIGLSDHYVWDAGSVVVDPATGRRASVQGAYNVEATDFQKIVQYGKEALAFASTEFPGVPYPYPKTTIFRGGADEEYPMMANDESYVGNETFTHLAAAHELMHSWFPFYMGTNEQRYGFMDEGWTTAFEHLFGKQALGDAGAIALFQAMRSRNLTLGGPGADIPIITAGDSLRGQIVSDNEYGKPALGYLALIELMGDDLFRETMGEFVARWNGKHPLPWDMFNSFNNSSGQNYNWFFNNWFFSTNYLDLAIGDVQPTADGVTVEVNNVGGLAQPFDVELYYDDDTMDSFRQNPVIWRDSPKAATVELVTPKEVLTVTLNGGIYMDYTPSDNTWSAP